MGRSVVGLVAQLIITLTIFAVNMLLISVASVLRLLPTLLPLLGRLLWAGLLLSCRLYYLLLTRAAPWIEQRTGIHLVEGLWRLAATLLLSLGSGLVFLLLAGWPVIVWTVLPIVLHGLFVALVWDEIPDQGGLQLGMRL